MGTLLMSFLKGLFARRLTATSFLTLKKCWKNDLLKNTKQVHRTCVGNHQFSKLEKQIPRMSWDIRGFFFHDKKEFKREKIFQTCTMNIRGIFFHDVFFFFAEKNPRNCAPLWLLKQKYFCFQAQSQAIPEVYRPLAFTKISVPVILWK